VIKSLGSVKFDLTTKEKIFKEINFTSFEDVYDALWMLDSIMDGYENMNVEAIVTKVDFFDIINEIDSDVLNEYVNIQIGKNPMQLDDYGKEITEVIAERLHITLDQCESELTEAIELIISQQHREWFLNYLNNYKGLTVPDKQEKKIEDMVSLKDWERIDYEKKYLWKKNVKPLPHYPEQLNDLLDLRQKNNKKIDQLERDMSDLKLLKKLYRERIRIDEDITDIKHSFGFKVADTNWKGRSDDRIAYQDNLDIEELNTYDLKVFDELAYHKIMSIADEVLTDKQRVVFYLYFENELKQEEIATIVDDTQGNISRDLKNILHKIQKCL
jgi:hypothetical protein